MNDIGFGLWLTVVGMGTVFGLLLLLWLVLRLIGSAGEATAAAGAEPPAASELPAPGQASAGEEPLDLSEDQIAAISVAVITHARVRRLQAAPAMRTHEPGSHLFASRWVAVGRAHQSQPWQRGK